MKGILWLLVPPIVIINISAHLQILVSKADVINKMDQHSACCICISWKQGNQKLKNISSINRYQGNIVS